MAKRIICVNVNIFCECEEGYTPTGQEILGNLKTDVNVIVGGKIVKVGESVNDWETLDVEIVED